MRTVNGRTLDASVVLRAIQEYFVYDESGLALEGNITEPIRRAYQWREKKHGIGFSYKMVDADFHSYKFQTYDLPDVVYEYYAEMIDPQAPNAGRTLGTAAVLSALQSHFDLEGEQKYVIMNAFRLCHLWDEQYRGGYYRWQMVEKEYEEFVKSDTMPNCVNRYYADMVHSRE